MVLPILRGQERFQAGFWGLHPPHGPCPDPRRSRRDFPAQQLGCWELPLTPQDELWDPSQPIPWFHHPRVSFLLLFRVKWTQKKALQAGKALSETLSETPNKSLSEILSELNPQ